MRRHSGPQDGFTLIELMLAVALLGLIMLALAGSFAAVAHSKVHAESRLTLDREARTILWQLSRELRGAVQTPFAPSRVYFIGQGHTENNKPLDSVTFATLDPGHRRALIGVGAEQTVSYTSKPNRHWRGCFVLSRVQQSTLIDGNVQSASTMPIVMADNLLQLHLRYFDGSRWNETWNSQTTGSGRMLPLAVLIDLVLATPNGRSVQYSTEVSLPMANMTR